MILLLGVHFSAHALLCASDERVSDVAEALWLMEKARIIDSMEREMSPRDRDLLNDSSWVTIGDNRERFLQIEVQNPDFYNDVDLRSAAR